MFPPRQKTFLYLGVIVQHKFKLCVFSRAQLFLSVGLCTAIPQDAK